MLSNQPNLEKSPDTRSQPPAVTSQLAPRNAHLTAPGFGASPGTPGIPTPTRQERKLQFGIDGAETIHFNHWFVYFNSGSSAASMSSI